MKRSSCKTTEPKGKWLSVWVSDPLTACYVGKKQTKKNTWSSEVTLVSLWFKKHVHQWWYDSNKLCLNKAVDDILARDHHILDHWNSEPCAIYKKASERSLLSPDKYWLFFIALGFKTIMHKPAWHQPYFWEQFPPVSSKLMGDSHQSQW